MSGTPTVSSTGMLLITITGLSTAAAAAVSDALLVMSTSGMSYPASTAVGQPRRLGLFLRTAWAT